MSNFKQHIEDLFKDNDKFSDRDNKLYTNTILEAIESIDSDLIKILINDDVAKKHFFTTVEGIYVLNQIKLIEFFTINNHFEDSYTSYSNKIGLIKKDNFIKKFDDVVLAFPHKDCILEAGQSKDDDKSKENFFNNIINSDEIDRLEEPKVLTNIKRYSKDKIEENPTINDEDNLIIKGNNLLALYSLREKYNRKVKLIYIDPPYNTGKDSFGYNDNFNHSTWLTFMKNRLEVAKEFLSDEGMIFISIDDNEQAYLKVLMDEIFSSDNNKFIANVIWENKEGGGKSDSQFFRNKHEYILVYAKNYNKASINGLDVEDVDRYKEFDKYEKTRGKYQLIKLDSASIQYSKSLDYPIKSPENTNILAGQGIKKSCWRWGKEKFEWGLKNDFVVIKKDRNNNWAVYTKQYLNCNNEGDIIKRTLPPIAVLSKYSTTQSSKHLKELFGTSIFNYSKPEGYIEYILKIATNPNDLVMDFHLGSGTTCAVAHKMGRRYIGIEQMDYIENISVERMKKVIDGEQGGISKAVNWQGGGSFIYAELKEIDNFQDKSIEALSQNMKYLPISDIEDDDYKISKEEIKINKRFYGIDK